MPRHPASWINPPPLPALVQPGSFMKQERPRWSGPLDCPPEQGLCTLLMLAGPTREDHLEGDARWRQITVNVRADGDGLVLHAGSALLAQVADKTGLTRAVNETVGEPGLRAGSHQRGRVIRDLAVMLADGGDCLADLRAVGDQAALFGPTASPSTAFRVIDRIASTPGLLLRHRRAQRNVRRRGKPLPIVPLVLGYLIGYLATIIPVPGGFGVLEGGLAGTLIAYGAPPTQATAAVIVCHAIAFWIPTLGGLSGYTMLRRRLNRPQHAAPATTEPRPAAQPSPQTSRSPHSLSARRSQSQNPTPVPRAAD